MYDAQIFCSSAQVFHTWTPFQIAAWSVFGPDAGPSQFTKVAIGKEEIVQTLGMRDKFGTACGTV